tara:strand:- start:83 stop:580 length:498 start_codon:yes stop_codon:yes gene_type:complete
MKSTIKNFLTFGLYNKVCEVEKKSTSYYSELKRSIEDLDIDSQVEEEINRRNVLTEDNFSPSNYSLVQDDDWDFDSFATQEDAADEVNARLEDYYDVAQMDEAIRDAVAASQLKFIEDTVKKVCTQMLVDWCRRTAEAAELSDQDIADIANYFESKQEETDSSSE